MPLDTFTVEEAEISVFPVDADGQAKTDSPLWIGACAEGITLSDALEEVEDRPSGSPFPEVHHGAEMHEITISRIWEAAVPVVTQPADLSVSLATADLANNRPAPNAVDYKLQPGQTYILVLKWEDAGDPERFIYRVYHGVTDRSYEITGQSDGPKQAAHRWRAQYFES